MDKELLQHMKRAGCYAVAYGIESASPDIIKVINKGITLEQAEEAVRISRLQVRVLCGLPSNQNSFKIPLELGKMHANSVVLKWDFEAILVGW
ncbi:hypothetical protein ES703_99113 [subsurface metagenome]